jgi:hypothetical protein
MEIPETTSNPTIVAPYPTSTRQYRSSVIPLPKKMARELLSKQSNHVAYINKMYHQKPKIRHIKRSFK